MLDKYIESLQCLQKENWDELNWRGREKALQNIVDCYGRLIGIESLCKVWVVPFDKNDSAIATYDPRTKQLEIREDLVVDGKMLMRGNKYRDLVYPANYVFFYLMHEVKHVIQQYNIEHSWPAENSIESKLTQYNQKHAGSDTNSYFSRIEDRNNDMHMYAHCLYMLQPTERYAWEFAYKQLDFFINKMHELFPNDRAFIDQIEYSSFHENLQWAKDSMFSFDPTRDIDNIVLTMNGEYVEEQLNEFMCSVIRVTQEPHMYERIKFYQERNEKFLAEQEFIKQQRSLDKDVSDLFQNESQEFDHDNFDDLFQNISDRR